MDGCGSGEASVSSNGSSSIDQEREWVQQDEPGVYLTIRAHPGGIRELRRVRFRLTFSLSSFYYHLYCL